jgi:hypothetical protein
MVLTLVRVKKALYTWYKICYLLPDILLGAFLNSYSLIYLVYFSFVSLQFGENIQWCVTVNSDVLVSVLLLPVESLAWIQDRLYFFSG